MMGEGIEPVMHLMKASAVLILKQGQWLTLYGRFLPVVVGGVV